MADANETYRRLSDRLDKQIARTRRARNITLGIGALLIAVLIIYFSVLSAIVRDLMTPQSVAEIAVSEGERRLPEWRQAITTELTAQANPWMNGLANEAEAMIPAMRQRGEDHARKNFALFLNELEIGINEFSDYLFETQAYQIREVLDMLDDDSKMPAVEEEFYAMFMEPIYESNAHVDLNAYGIALSELAGKVEMLAANEDLNEGQRIERDLLVALRLISLRSDTPEATRLVLPD